MKRKLMTLLAAGALCIAASAAPKDFSLSSPDGKLSVSISVDKSVSYSLTHDGTLLLSPSEISMTLGDGTVYGGEAKFLGKKTRSVSDEIQTLNYKKTLVKDDFNELTLRFKGFNLIFRAYDDGMAYRFVSLSNSPFKVKSEQAEFDFPEDWTAYVPYVRDFDRKDFSRQFFNSFENRYVHIALSGWDADRIAFLPLVIEAPQGRKICITEADLLDYPGMYLYNGDASHSLKGVFAHYPDKVKQGGHNMLQMVVETRKDYIAEYETGTSFPWRIVVVSENDAQLADNDMVYRLATPAVEGDFSWVKPGKVAWEWWNHWNLYGVDFETGINDRTYKYYIDFAADHGIEYVILDEGWAVNLKADLLQVVPEIDLKELADYAASKNVGLILWAGYWAFDRDMENVCRHYSEMGIKGFKVDFMDRDDQIMVDFHRRAAETAAKYGLMIDFHGTYKPTGLHRTYPNVVNYEGVFGLEQMKWSDANVDQVTYDVTIPFIRMVAGPFDYTQGAMRNASKGNYRQVNSEAMSQGTRCRQLAEYVVFESPLNMLCDSPSNYMREPECTDFIAGIPTVWNETVAVNGEIAKYITMARRNGDEWYLGSMTDWSARDLVLDLSFLGDGDFEMVVFRDGKNADKVGRDYVKETVAVPASRKMTIHMAPGGGFAAKITKK